LPISGSALSESQSALMASGSEGYFLVSRFSWWSNGGAVSMGQLSLDLLQNISEWTGLPGGDSFEGGLEVTTND